MRLDDDFDEQFDNEYDYEPERFHQSSAVIYAVVLVSLAILGILMIVLLGNRSLLKNQQPSVSGQAVTDNGVVSQNMYSDAYITDHGVDELISGSTLTAEDLDIWGSYEEDNQDATATSSPLPEEDAQEDPSSDGQHTEIVYADGTSEWVSINPYLERNTYNYANLVYQSPLMKYYENNVRVSYAGAEITKEHEYVDYHELASAGIDFVMLRLGQRGYESGEITLDESFYENCRRATDAGLDVGVYFFSQAITKEEAVEEAEFVIASLSQNEISYPVVFYMEPVEGQIARADDLNQMQRTNIAIAFMDKIREAGYFPMLYGNKEWLIQKYSFGSLIGYDIWLSQEGDIPDFPYSFQMWRYTEHGTIQGVAGDVSLNICFTDYSVK